VKRVNRIVTVEMTVERGDDEFDVSVKGRFYQDPGQSYGPWERCYPPETDVELLDAWADGRDFSLDDLTQAEVARAESLIADEVCEDEWEDCE
jgi:hypothetical protein